MKKKNIIDLEILEDFIESGVSKISLVDRPAIEVDWLAFREEAFVKPSAGEKKDDFIPRCIQYVVKEGKDQDQAAAICYSMWDQAHNEVDTGFMDWDQCIELQKKRGLPQENAERLCGWIKDHVQGFSYDPAGLPEYVDQITEDKKEKLEDREIDVFGYKTKYFYICPGAIGTFTHLTQMEVSDEDRGMIRSAAVLADKIFEIEAEVVEKGSATADEVKEVILLVDDFKDLMREIDEEVGMVHDVAYMDGHVEVVYSYYSPEQAFAAIEDLQVGTPVSWKTPDQNPRGRIREIIRNGGKTVPGTSFVLQGTPEDPGYIIEIYEKVNGEWKPSGKYAGRKADSILKNVELWRQERQVFASEDEQIVVGPAMIPDMEIPRKDEKTGQPYYVKFSKEVIAKIAEKFMRELRNDQTNIDHKDNDAGSYVMETWIVEDPAHDKINSKYGFNLPEGTWAVKMRVQDPETWKMIKAGKLNGFSIEGSFMSKEDYEDFMDDRKLFDEIKKLLRAE